MTNPPTLPPKQQALFDEVGRIGRRVNAGEITEDEAKTLVDDVMARLRVQTVEDVEIEMGKRLKARQRKALLILGVLAVAVAAAVAIVVLR